MAARERQRDGSARRAAGSRGPVGKRLAALGLFNTRRAAILALVVCALALSVAVPLRTYLSQRAEVETQLQRQDHLREKVERLERRQAQLSDPAQIEAEARERLRYVMPGETPYIVQLPGDGEWGAGPPTGSAPERQRPWYEQLWADVTGDSGAR